MQQNINTAALRLRKRKRCELISGQKLEKTWLGTGNSSEKVHTLEKNENGEYLILLEAKEEKKELEKANAK